MAFARRDRRPVEEARARYWEELARELTPAAALALADGLREHVRALRPEWPTAEDRAADLEMHVRLSEALRRVRLPAAR